MGEISDMMMEGILCEQCGSFIEDAESSGFPRKCADCLKESSKTIKPKGVSEDGRFKYYGLLSPEQTTQLLKQKNENKKEK